MSETAQSTELSTGRRKGKVKSATGDGRTMSRPIRLFCQAMMETGDATRAYQESHAACTSPARAKYNGRALLKRGDVRAYMAELKAKAAAGQGDTDPRKSALLAELNVIAFHAVKLGKLHPKEKLTALRTIAEIEGWMKPPSAGAGIKATFNFRIGGRLVGPPAEQAVTVDMDTAAVETASPAPAIEAPVVESSAPGPAAALFDGENT